MKLPAKLNTLVVNTTSESYHNGDISSDKQEYLVTNEYVIGQSYDKNSRFIICCSTTGYLSEKRAGELAGAWNDFSSCYILPGVDSIFKKRITASLQYSIKSAKEIIAETKEQLNTNIKLLKMMQNIRTTHRKNEVVAS